MFDDMDINRNETYERINELLGPRLRLKESGTGAEIRLPYEKGELTVGHLFLEFGSRRIRITGNPALFTAEVERLEEADFTVWFLDTKKHEEEIKKIEQLLLPDCHLWRFSDPECGEIYCNEDEGNEGEFIFPLDSNRIELRGNFSCDADGIPFGYEKAIGRLRAAGYEVEVSTLSYYTCDKDEPEETDWDEEEVDEEEEMNEKSERRKVGVRHGMYFLLRGLGGVLLFLTLLAIFTSWTSSLGLGMFCSALVVMIIAFMLWSPEKTKYSRRKETGWREVLLDVNEQWFFWSVVYLIVVGLLLLYGVFCLIVG